VIEEGLIVEIGGAVLIRSNDRKEESGLAHPSRGKVSDNLPYRTSISRDAGPVGSATPASRICVGLIWKCQSYDNDIP